METFFSVGFVFAAIALFSQSVAYAEDITLGHATVSFATPEQARAILTNRDQFLSMLSPFDRAFRLQSQNPVSESEFVHVIEKSVLPWTSIETNRIVPVLKELSGRIAPLHLALPAKVLLIKTTGREEMHSFYTRQNAIIMPQDQLAHMSPFMLAHELFHVLSRENPGLQAKLYGLIGFQRINEIVFAQEWQDRRVTNPDGPENCWRIVLTNGDHAISAIPTLLAPSNSSPNKLVNPTTFFTFVEVTNRSGHWEPALDSGQPKLLKPQQVTGFYEQIGHNTRYIIHPDEILADNFADLLCDRTNVPTPEILTRMKTVFASEHPATN